MFDSIKTLNKHSRLLIIVSFAEFWDMISFFGTVAILVLYTTKVFLFSDHESYIIYGIYLALFCGLPVIGGLITDKLLGEYRSVILGAILIILGNLALCLKSKIFLFSGLSLTITGTALYKTTCTNLVGEVYSKDLKIKNRAYTFFYAVLNCGAIVGPVSYGLFANYFGWNYCFLLSAIGITLCLICFICFKLDFLEIEKNRYPKNIKKQLKAIILVVVSFLFVLLSFFKYEQFNKIIFISIAVIIGVYLYTLLHQNKKHRKNLIGILLLLSFCVFFFAASLQVGSSITLYLSRFINRNFFSWEIPTTFFTSLNPLFLVMAAPIFSFLWAKLALSGKEPTSTTKLGIGLVICSLGFICFWLTSFTSNLEDNYFKLIFLILGYFFLGAGEICLSPAVLTSISTYSPKNIENMMMGGWYFFMSLAGYLGSFIDQSITSFSQKISIHQLAESRIIDFQHIFIFICLLTLIPGLILFILSKAINKFFVNRTEDQIAVDNSN